MVKELFNIKPGIDDRANAIVYQISIVSSAFSGHIINSYDLTYKQHIRLFLITVAQQINLIDRLLYKYDFENRDLIIHRVFIGQARLISSLIPQYYEQGSLDFFSDKQLEYSQYPQIIEKNDVDYPIGTLLWEFGEEIAKNSDRNKNHQIIMQTIGTYKYYYLKNSEIMNFIKA
tara:strand:+ start:1378 stop:1899 length:522 start_codon:yes stop_codon:yes gene_type:complete